ncbi:DUF6313 family protein [Micromonospora sp. WMMA1949]|uniref:DUF6313 family protein n=2 Tax=Micromonospora sp. WMMA1949 TaxID=3015162 RepID=UPI002FC3652B
MRRSRRSMPRHGGFRFWISSWGVGIVSLMAALYIVNGFCIGWQRAYNVTIGITSPGDVAFSYLAWPLSLAGWLVGPAVAGAVAGWVVNDFISSRRTTPPLRVLGGEEDA